MELPLQQHPSFGTALGLVGTPVKRVDIPGAAPTQIIKRFGIGFAPRGPIWQREDAQTLRDSPIRLLNAETASDIHQQAGFRQVMTPAHVAELDLRSSPQTRLNATHGKWRNAWRKAQKSRLNLQHTTFDNALHGWLLQADQTQQRSKGFRALPHSIVQAYAVIKPQDVIVFGAKRKHDMVAAMLFLRHGAVATYHLGWTSDQGRASNAHHAILMQAADHFADQGCTRLDLGTVDTENAAGLARFKIGSGADIRALGGTWLRLPGF